MDITVFGANGRVGKLVVGRALTQGHQVRAFVHSHDPFDPHQQLSVLAGDVLNARAVQDAIGRADAVISTLGAFRRGTGPVLASGLRNITQAMASHGTPRLVVLTGAGVAQHGGPNSLRTGINRAMLTLMDRTAVADADGALTIMAGTDLAWTTVCAPTITTDGRNGYLLTTQMPSLLAKVPGPAVAACLVELAERPTTTNPVVGIKRAPASK